MYEKQCWWDFYLFWQKQNKAKKKLQSCFTIMHATRCNLLYVTWLSMAVYWRGSASASVVFQSKHSQLIEMVCELRRQSGVSWVGGWRKDASERDAIWGIVILPTHTHCFTFTSAHPFTDSWLALILTSSCCHKTCL